MNDNANELPKNYIVPAVEQAVRVMLCLANNGSNPKNLTDICREVGIHRSKAFSILNTLNEFGLVKKNPNRKGYVLGPGLLTLTGKILKNLNLPRLVEPTLQDLARKTGALAALGVISDDKAFVVAQCEGPGLGVSAPIGRVAPISYGAHGKAIAAFLTEHELEDLLEDGDLYFFGNPDKFDRARLMEDLARCKRDGFAVDLGDVNPSLNAVSSPLLDPDKKPVGYITIVGFFPKEDAFRFGPLVASAAKTISKDTGNMIYWKGLTGRKITSSGRNGYSPG
jgi:DNA-binding IclR family transcriptional regulator